MSAFPIPGKVALVTGSARGIGFETAKLLHQRGASVAIVDLRLADAEAAAKAIGERTLALEVDVTDYEALTDAIEQITDTFGGLDLVVANAGIAPSQAASLHSMDYDEFERVVDVDLMGVWRTVRAALPQIIERRGHIVVISSVYAFLNGTLNSPYGIAKAGVESMGRALRAELHDLGASAGVAYFGFIDTDMVRDAFDDPSAQKLQDTLPKFVSKRLQPAQAAKTIVDGVEKRAPRMIAPRWWGIYSVLRGIINPILDRRLETDAKLREVIREAERDNAAKLKTKVEVG